MNPERKQKEQSRSDVRNTHKVQSTINSSNTSTTSSSPANKQGEMLDTQLTYSIISVVAILGNTLVILLIVLNRETLLKKSYNMLILSLAISDFLTALLIITNPLFVLGDAFPYPTNAVLADIVCRVIWSRAFLFQLVVFSAYICMALATERWYAVVRPHRYKVTFNRKRTLLYIFLVWLWSFILTCSSLFEIGYAPSNPSNYPCKWQFLTQRRTVRVALAIVQVLLKMAFPCLTMVFLFIHMVYKTSRSTVASAESKAKMRGKITRMVGAASLTLIICFAPSQISYALAIAGKSRLDTKLHLILSIMAFVNSSLNPFIYGLSNSNYRQGYQRILLSVCPRCIRDNGNRVAPSDTST